MMFLLKSNESWDHQPYHQTRIYWMTVFDDSAKLWITLSANVFGKYGMFRLGKIMLRQG